MADLRAQSYLDLILHRLTYRAVSFGFADAQARLTYDISPRQRIDLTALAGRSRFENDPVEREIDDVHVGLNASVVGVAGWRFTLPRLMLTQRVLAADNHFRNQNIGRTSSWTTARTGSSRIARTSRPASIAHSRSPRGAEVERRDDSRVRRRLAPNRVSLVQLDDYSGDGLLTGGYASARWTPFSRLTVAPGVRADRWSLTGQSTDVAVVPGRVARDRHAQGARRRRRLPAVPGLRQGAWRLGRNRSAARARASSSTWASSSGSAAPTACR